MTGSNLNNPWLFASKRLHTHQTIQSGKRDYDSNLGRWLTPDPLGFADGPNLYTYIQNNPLILFDPYRLISCHLYLHDYQPKAFQSRSSRTANSSRKIGSYWGCMGLLGGGQIVSDCRCMVNRRFIVKEVPFFWIDHIDLLYFAKWAYSMFLCYIPSIAKEIPLEKIPHTFATLADIDVHNDAKQEAMTILASRFPEMIARERKEITGLSLSLTLPALAKSGIRGELVTRTMNALLPIVKETTWDSYQLFETLSALAKSDIDSDPMTRTVDALIAAAQSQAGRG